MWKRAFPPLPTRPQLVLAVYPALLSYHLLVYANIFSKNGETSKTMQNKSKLPSKYNSSGQFSPISTNIQEFIDKNILKNAIFEQNFLKFQCDVET